MAGKFGISPMLIQTFQKGDAASRAVYSDCQAYRYALTRVWNQHKGQMLFVMLNPSTATERQNDPTIERCERRARQLGFGGVQIANLFAFRSTDPKALRNAPDPVGPQNDAVLLSLVDETGPEMILCAWGVHGGLMGRGIMVETMLRAEGHRLWHLGLTAAGHPRHPLYVAYDRAPIPWP